MNEKPRSIVVKYAHLIPAGIVLELGSGSGATVAFLAEKNKSVIAVDQKITKIPGVNCIQQDIESFDFEFYAGIICLNVLHFLKQPLLLLQKMKEHTTQGGVNIVSTFTTQGDLVSSKFFKPEQLRQYYSDWQIIHYEEVLKPTKEKKDNKTLMHTVASLVAINSSS